MVIIQMQLCAWLFIISLLSTSAAYAKKDIFDSKTIFSNVPTCNSNSQTHFPSQERMPRHCFEFESASSLGLASSRDSKEGTIVKLKLIDTGIDDIFNISIEKLMKNPKSLKYLEQWDKNLKDFGAKDRGQKTVALAIECARLAQMYGYNPGESMVFYSEENVGDGEPIDLNNLSMLPRNPNGKNNASTFSSNELFLSIAKDVGETGFRVTGNSPEMTFDSKGGLNLTCPALKSVATNADKTERAVVLPAFSFKGTAVSSETKASIIKELKVDNLDKYITSCDGGDGTNRANIFLEPPIHAPVVQFTMKPNQMTGWDLNRWYEKKEFLFSWDGVANEFRLYERVPPTSKIKGIPEIVHRLGLSSETGKTETSRAAAPGKANITSTDFYVKSDDTHRYIRDGGIPPVAGPYEFQLKDCNFQINTGVFDAANPSCKEVWHCTHGKGKPNPQAVCTFTSKIVDPYGFSEVIDNASRVVAPCTQVALRASKKAQQPGASGSQPVAPIKRTN